MSDVTIVCDSCRGTGEIEQSRGHQGHVCEACAGTGHVRCRACRELPATVLADGTRALCEGCNLIESACGLCLSGDPVCFIGETPACSACADALRESARSSDTLPCSRPPDGCEAA